MWPVRKISAAISIAALLASTSAALAVHYRVTDTGQMTPAEAAALLMPFALSRCGPDPAGVVEVRVRLAPSGLYDYACTSESSGSLAEALAARDAVLGARSASWRWVGRSPPTWAIVKTGTMTPHQAGALLAAFVLAHCSVPPSGISSILVSRVRSGSPPQAMYTWSCRGVGNASASAIEAAMEAAPDSREIVPE